MLLRTPVWAGILAGILVAAPALREIFAANSPLLQAGRSRQADIPPADSTTNHPETDMKTFRLLLPLGLLFAAPAFAGNDYESCSTRMLAGRWMFATDVGHQALFPGSGDITAIGVFRIDRLGTVLDGVFDATVEKFRFLPDLSFSGSVVVNANCTGTLTFVTSAGTTRSDSIVVIGPGHIRGMSQDINNLWTYDMRRL
jgi:hypothetical protein